MKQILILLFLGLSFNSTIAQVTSNETIMHDGIEREYILYVPDSYEEGTAVPLVFNFHGYGSNGFEQMIYGDFRSIADTANFILVHPEGTELDGVTHWNVGGFTFGSTVDDVGFVNAMIEELSATYSINPDRVYSTGMSNGGYMSFELACQLSNKIAAVASVTGSMSPENLAACDPQHPTPVMQIHGTDDSVVPYGGAIWTEPIEDVLEYWIDYNNCETTALMTDIENTNTGDGSTVEYFVYENGDNDATTEHFKIDGGDHTWPGNFIGGFGTNYDIDASFEIWKFFSRYDINGSINPNGIEDIAQDVFDLEIYPNPASDILNISFQPSFDSSCSLRMFNSSGQMIKSIGKDEIAGRSTLEINLKDLTSGIYTIELFDGTTYSRSRVVKI